MDRPLFPPLQLASGSRAQAVDWVGGAAMMVRRDAFLDVGGFDSSIFMYMEDVDLCRRLRANGWTIRYEPGVSVEHDLGGSQGPSRPTAGSRRSTGTSSGNGAPGTLASPARSLPSALGCEPLP